MRGRYLICSVIAFVGIAVFGAHAEQLQKISPDNVGFTIQPFINGDPSGPPTVDPSLRGPLLDPTVPAVGPSTVAAVPEPSTIAMLFLGSGCAGAFAAFRRRRRN
jgi:hypothetical protein